jgi:DNA-binding FrmR family transcriptional regulator
MLRWQGEGGELNPLQGSITMAKSTQKTQQRKPASDATAPTCECGPLHNGAAAHGAHAVAVDASIKEANLKQLRRIEGQVRGIAAMVEQERYCADIINQVSAVRESLHTVARNLMRNHLKHCAATAMQNEGDQREQMINEILELVSKLGR